MICQKDLRSIKMVGQLDLKSMKKFVLKTLQNGQMADLGHELDLL